MATKKQTHTLSTQGVADFKEIGRRVLRKGPDSICTPYNRGSLPQANPDLIRLKNITSGTLNAHVAVRIGNPVNLPTDSVDAVTFYRHPYYEVADNSGGYPPTYIAGDTVHWCVPKADIAPGKTGYAAAGGVTQAYVAKYADWHRAVTFNGLGLHTNATGEAELLWIGEASGPALIRFNRHEGTFHARITGNTQDGTNKRWFYSWEEVIAQGTGTYTNAWVPRPNGLTGSAAVAATRALNRFEAMNGSSGTYGNGVASTNLTGTFTVKPIPAGLIVKLSPPLISSLAGVGTWWFEATNGIDGACP